MASSGKSGGSKNGIKLAIIGVCFAAACVLLAYNFGLIESPFAEKPKPIPQTQEDTKATEDFNKNAEKIRKSTTTTEGGS